MGVCNASDRTHGLERRLGRVVIVGMVGVAALILAGPSLGAVTPHLVVTASPAAGGIQTLSISASTQKSDDQVGRIQLFVPTGFTLNSPPAGTQVGRVTARVVLGDLNPAAEKSSSGSVLAISPTDPAVAYEDTNCDPSQHLAAWIARLGTGKTVLSVPIFVDATSDTAASFGPYVLVVCFRPADLPATDPNRSTRRRRYRLVHAHADTIHRADDTRRVSLAVTLDTVRSSHQRTRSGRQRRGPVDRPAPHRRHHPQYHEDHHQAARDTARPPDHLRPSAPQRPTAGRRPCQGSPRPAPFEACRPRARTHRKRRRLPPGRPSCKRHSTSKPAPTSRRTTSAQPAASHLSRTSPASTLRPAQAAWRRPSRSSSGRAAQQPCLAGAGGDRAPPLHPRIRSARCASSFSAARSSSAAPLLRRRSLAVTR